MYLLTKKLPKCACHEEDLRNELKHKINIISVMNAIYSLQADSKKHLYNSDYDCQFHFKGIKERELIVCNIPLRV